MTTFIILRGGGDLATGVALRLYRAGLSIIITELPQPLVVRRRVAFAEAVYEGETTVEGVRALRTEHLDHALALASTRVVPVLVDPGLDALATVDTPASLPVLIDARMTKKPAQADPGPFSLVIGLGPGFVPGLNCHAAVETNRGHCLGRVLWHEAPEADTGIPDIVNGIGVERVLRSPADGHVAVFTEIGEHVQPGQAVAEVAGQVVHATFPGVVRGLVRAGLPVTRGLKIGDIDPRNEPRFCFMVSDKSLAIGGAVLEAILSRPELRAALWDCPA